MSRSNTSRPNTPRARLDRTTTANDELKTRFQRHMIVSTLIAIAAHVGAILWWPSFEVEYEMAGAETMAAITAEEKIDLPETKPLPRPARPVIATTDVSEDITIGKTTITDQPPIFRPPEPAVSQDKSGQGEEYVPYTLGPRLLNERETLAALERQYPPLLQDTGIGGRVVLRLQLSAEGAILSKVILVSSEYQSMDMAALNVADTMRFSPAMNREKPVAVTVDFPLVFEVRKRRRH